MKNLLALYLRIDALRISKHIVHSESMDIQAPFTSLLMMKIRQVMNIFVGMVKK